MAARMRMSAAWSLHVEALMRLHSQFFPSG